MVLPMARTPSDPFMFSGSLSLERGGHSVAGPDRLGLLQLIHVHGSISAAAKAAGISYRTAWLAVDAMNNLAGEVLVERSTGGAHGGGARLSSAGIRVLDSYRLLQERQRAFLARENLPAQPADQLMVLQSLGLRSSARNQIRARVARYQITGPQVTLQLMLACDQGFSALISKQSLESLDLARGDWVIVLIKATAIDLVTPGERIPARYNRLQGAVSGVEGDQGSRNEFAIQLPEGPTLYALPERSTGVEAFVPGSPALAVFDPAAVVVMVLP